MDDNHTTHSSLPIASKTSESEAMDIPSLLSPLLLIGAEGTTQPNTLGLSFPQSALPRDIIAEQPGTSMPCHPYQDTQLEEPIVLFSDASLFEAFTATYRSLTLQEKELDHARREAEVLRQQGKVLTGKLIELELLVLTIQHRYEKAQEIAQDEHERANVLFKEINGRDYPVDPYVVRTLRTIPLPRNFAARHEDVSLEDVDSFEYV